MIKNNILKRVSNSVVSLIACSAMVFSPTMAYAEGFSDVEDSWATDVIEKWTQNNWIKGYEDGSFKPNDSISRAEFVSLINRIMEFNQAGSSDFSDVDNNYWAYDQIVTAKENGYVKGYEDGTFKPNNYISRAEAAKLISNIIGYYEGDAAMFKDINDIPDWSISAVTALADREIITGYTDGSFKPSAEITRSEAVVMLDRFKTLYDNSEIISKSLVTIKDKTIKGDVIITEDVAEGTVTFSHVVIEGDLIIRGGGAHSINLRDTEVKGTIFTDKKDVHVNLNDKSIVGKINTKKEASFTIDKESIVSDFEINSSIDIAGEGNIKLMNVNAQDVSISNKIITGEMNTAKDIEKPEVIFPKPEQTDSSGSSNSSDSGNTGNTEKPPVEEPKIEYDEEELNEMVMNKSGLEKVLAKKVRKLSVLVAASIADEVKCEAVAEELNIILEDGVELNGLIIKDKYATEISIDSMGTASIFNLSIDAPKAHVESNVDITNVNIEAVKPSSFVANKNINCLAFFGKGRVEINAKVNQIQVSTSEEVVIDGNQSIEELVVENYQTDVTPNIELNVDVNNIKVNEKSQIKGSAHVNNIKVNEQSTIHGLHIDKMIANNSIDIDTSVESLEIPATAINHLIISGHADIKNLDVKKDIQVKSAGNIQHIDTIRSVEIDAEVVDVEEIVVKKGAEEVVLNINAKVHDIETSESVTFAGKACVDKVHLSDDAGADTKLYAEDSCQVEIDQITKADGQEIDLVKSAKKPEGLGVSVGCVNNSDYIRNMTFHIFMNSYSDEIKNGAKIKYYESKDAKEPLDFSEDYSNPCYPNLEIEKILFDENGYGSLFISAVKDGYEESQRVEYKYEIPDNYRVYVTTQFQDVRKFYIKSGENIHLDFDISSKKGTSESYICYKLSDENDFGFHDSNFYASLDKMEMNDNFEVDFSKEKAGKYVVYVVSDHEYVDVNGENVKTNFCSYFDIYVDDNSNMDINDVNCYVQDANNFNDISLNLYTKDKFEDIINVILTGELSDIINVESENSKYYLTSKNDVVVDENIKAYEGQLQIATGSRVYFKKIILNINKDITDLEKLLVSEIGNVDNPSYIRDESEYSSDKWKNYVAAINEGIKVAKDEASDEDNQRLAIENIKKTIAVLYLVDAENLDIRCGVSQENRASSISIYTKGEWKDKVCSGIKFKIYDSIEAKETIDFRSVNILDDEIECYFKDDYMFFDENGIGKAYVSTYIEGVEDSETERVEYCIENLMNYSASVESNYRSHNFNIREFYLYAGEILNFDFNIYSKRGEISIYSKLCYDRNDEELDITDTNGYTYTFNHSVLGDYQLHVNAKNKYIDIKNEENSIWSDNEFNIHVVDDFESFVNKIDLTANDASEYENITFELPKREHNNIQSVNIKGDIKDYISSSQNGDVYVLKSIAKNNLESGVYIGTLEVVYFDDVYILPISLTVDIKSEEKTKTEEATEDKPKEEVTKTEEKTEVTESKISEATEVEKAE